jgi:hypothetical protein
MTFMPFFARNPTERSPGDSDPTKRGLKRGVKGKLRAAPDRTVGRARRPKGSQDIGRR